MKGEETCRWCKRWSHSSVAKHEETCAMNPANRGPTRDPAAYGPWLAVHQPHFDQQEEQG